jgi:site-specific DNA-cytosine methylase
VDTTQTITHVSLCAGYGGIDLGLHRAIPNLRTIAVSEIEAFACANLVAKMEAGLLDPAPIWTDLKTFPWSDFRDRVDILFRAATRASRSQQPASDSEPKTHDTSGHLLQPELLQCDQQSVSLRTSRDISALGYPDVLQDLAGLGYRATWCVASASECGAPHQRKRVFILAYDLNGGRLPSWISGGLEGIRGRQQDNASSSSQPDSQLAYRHGERGQLPDWWREPAEQVPVGYGETWGDERGLENANNGGAWDRGTHGLCATQARSESLQQERQANGRRPQSAGGDTSRQSGQAAPASSSSLGSRQGLSVDWRTPQAQEAGAKVETLFTKDGAPAMPGQRAYRKTPSGKLVLQSQTINQQVEMVQNWATPRANERDGTRTPNGNPAKDGRFRWGCRRGNGAPQQPATTRAAEATSSGNTRS